MSFPPAEMHFDAQHYNYCNFFCLLYVAAIQLVLREQQKKLKWWQLYSSELCEAGQVSFQYLLELFLCVNLRPAITMWRLIRNYSLSENQLLILTVSISNQLCLAKSVI